LSVKLVLFTAEIATAEATMALEAILAPGVKTRTLQKIKTQNVNPLQIW
jgi:hypothetical protein